MPKSATRISDIQENVWSQSIGTAAVGIVVLVVSAILIWLMNYIPAFKEQPLIVKMLFAVAPTSGAAILLVALWRTAQVSKLAHVPFTCPFCDQVNIFPEAPTEDFDCEHCDRTVHFEDGQAVPVRTIKCPVCSTEHRVAVNVPNYLCDRCNRNLKLTPDSRYKLAVVRVREEEKQDEIFQNYDVLLVAIDRRHENDLAFKLQNLMVVNLPETRKLMATVSNKAPLIVMMDVPQRKAEVVRRQLQELGATVILRPTAAIARPTQKAR